MNKTKKKLLDWFTFSYKKFSLSSAVLLYCGVRKEVGKKRIMMRSFFIRFSFSVWETFTLLRVAIANYENSSKGSVLYDHEFSTCLSFHHHSLTRVKELKMIHGKSSKNQINICKKGRNRFFKTFFFNLRSLIILSLLLPLLYMLKSSLIMKFANTLRNVFSFFFVSKKILRGKWNECGAYYNLS